MTGPLHIGLAGGAGAGKDTVATMLVDAVGGPSSAVVIALADPLKRLCRTVYGFHEDQLWGPSERRAEPPQGRDGPTAREALQRLGTEWGRALDPDTWIRRLMFDVGLLSSPGPGRMLAYDRMIGVTPSPVPLTWRLVVTPDVRFPNEAAEIRRKGGLVWLVDRPGTAPPTGGTDGHESEAHAFDLPHDDTVRNHGSLHALRRAVRAMLSDALAGRREP